MNHINKKDLTAPFSPTNVEITIKQYIEKNGYKKLSIKSLLFDMDGVLYDSMPSHACSWVTVMRNNGFNMTEADAYLNEGRIGHDTIGLIAAREGKQVDIEERKRIYQEKTKLFTSCPPIKPIHRSVDFVQKITTAGLSAMLVTGSGQPSLLDQLNIDFPNVFTREKMVTSFDVKKGKPHPEPYLMALQKGGLQPSEAIVVENAPLGVEAACAAGLFVIAVNTGPLPDSVLFDAGANILFPSLEALSAQWDNFYVHTLSSLRPF